MRNSLISKESFCNFLIEGKLADSIDFDNLYELYLLVIETINDVLTQTKNAFNLYVNHYVVIFYIINEYKFYLFSHNITDHSLINKDSEEIQVIGSLCADKYLTNEKLNFKSEAFLNKFNPPVSTLDLYLNFSLRTLESIKVKDKNASLLKDMLTKAMKMGKCILNLLTDGFETEAFSTWRTLHENECIMICLVRNGNKMFDAYFKHIRYALAYRNQIQNKDEVDKIFEQIKSEMKEHDLKSKDMKKYIEYGYLYSAKEQSEDTPLKLNFRDGVEKLAGLSNYSKVYEMASEIAHSSPLLLFSRRSYYFEITLLNLYESFFRLEVIFEAFYRSVNNKEIVQQYENMKAVYLRELHLIYAVMQKTFIKNNIRPKKS